MVEPSRISEEGLPGDDWYYAIAQAISIICDLRLAELETTELFDEARKNELIRSRVAEALSQARTDLERTSSARGAVAHMDRIVGAYLALRIGL